MILFLSLLLRLRARFLWDLRWRIFGVLMPSAVIGLILLRHAGSLAAAWSGGNTTQSSDGVLHFFGSLFVAWVTLSVFGNFEWGWMIPLRLPYRLPLRPAAVFTAKTLAGLAGLWLLAILPCFLVEGWMCSAWRGLLCALPLAFAFALSANAVSSIGIFLLNWRGKPFVKIPLIAVAALSYSLFATGVASLIVAHNTSMIAQFVHLLQHLHLGWMDFLLPAKWTAAAFSALRAAEPGIYFITLAKFFTLTLGLCAAEFALSCHLHFKRSHSDAATKRETLAAKAFGWALRMPTGFRESSLLLFREAELFGSIPSLLPLTMLFFFYCPILVLFAHLPSITSLEGVFLLPFFFYLAVKSNLLGTEQGATNLLLSQPLGITAFLRAKNRLINGIVVGVFALAIALGEYTGALDLQRWESVFGLLYLFTTLTLWDVLSEFCSIRFNTASTSNGGEELGTMAAQGLLAVGPLGVFVAFAILQQIASKYPSKNLAAILVASFLAIFVFSFSRLIFRPWMQLESARKRETLYFALTKKVTI